MPVTSFVFARRTVIALGACVLMSACATVTVPATVTDSIAQNPSLTTLSGLLTSSGVGETLKGAGPFTVFAPSDDAFKAVPAKTLDELKQNPEKLRALLTYHVLPGKTVAADVKTGKVKSLQGSELEVSKSGEFVTVESAVVTSHDQIAVNGVVHVIDTVLMPPVKK